MNRRGVALVAALSLITLLGLLLVGAVTATTLAQRADRASNVGVPLAAAADYGVADVLARPDAYGLPELSLGGSTLLAVPVPDAPGIETVVSATRLSRGVVWLVAEARLSREPSMRRRVNLVARFPLDGVRPAASLTASGGVALAPDVIISSETASGECAATAAAPYEQTSDSTKLYLRPAQQAALDSAVGVVRALGDTTITSGVVDGLLLVGGDLVVDGPTEISGLVMVRGSVRSPRGLRLTGALVTQTGSIDLAGADIRFAPCVVGRALRRASPARAVRGRAWSELF